MTSQQPDPARFDERVACRILVQGVVTAEWANRLGGLVIVPTEDATNTLLAGELTDQVELISVLNTLHDLRLSIISVEESETGNASRFPEE